MSKLADLLKELNKTAAPTLGFRSVTEDSKPKAMIILCDLTPATAKKIKDASDGGMAAAIVRASGTEPDSLKQMAKSLGKIPLGMILDAGKSVDVNEYAAAGLDFVVFDINMPLSSVGKEDLGRVLKINVELPLGMLRAVSEISPPVDALYVDCEVSPLTIEKLLTCQFMSDATGKPLMISVDSALSESELKGLREAGVKALLLEGKYTKKTVSDLSDMIARLPKITRKKQERAILPHINSGVQSAEEEDDDNGDDDQD